MYKIAQRAFDNATAIYLYAQTHGDGKGNMFAELSTLSG